MARVAVSNRATSTRNNSILYNGGFEIFPTYVADTNTANRWIDGTAAGASGRSGYGWAVPSSGSGVGANSAAAFDTSIKRSGNASLRLSTLNASGTIIITNFKNNAPIASTLYQCFLLKPNTSYTLTGYIRTNNVVASAAFIDIREFSADITTLATTSTTKVGGTDTSFRQVTVTFTTNSSTVFGGLLLRINLAGNTSDAWFDDITLVPASISRSVASGRVAA